ncbi:MAG: hypothetical protein OSJ61_20410 [Lachnospiraceae bacterium]|nr:hypothetical protein [Lachnospiraceae bacterium]
MIIFSSADNDGNGIGTLYQYNTIGRLTEKLKELEIMDQLVGEKQSMIYIANNPNSTGSNYPVIDYN